MVEMENILHTGECLLFHGHHWVSYRREGGGSCVICNLTTGCHLILKTGPFIYLVAITAGGKKLLARNRSDSHSNQFAYIFA